jgi:uncharacterized protein YjbI with pentapeptide repeats
MRRQCICREVIGNSLSPLIVVEMTDEPPIEEQKRRLRRKARWTPEVLFLWTIVFVLAFAAVIGLAFRLGIDRGNRLGYIPIAVVVVLLLVRIGYRYEWTGFGEASHPQWSGGSELRPRKTLWDWLQLLGTLAIPIAVAVAGAWFTTVQSTTQQAVEEQRAQDDALQAYLDQMGVLLLEKNLRESEPGSEVRTLARARTLTVLSRLDPSRKPEVMGFLIEAELITSALTDEEEEEIRDKLDTSGHQFLDPPVIVLGTLGESPRRVGPLEGGPGLTGGAVDLHDVNLTAVSLFNAWLAHANLRDANLQSSDLTNAVLVGSTLTNATLRTTFLQGAWLQQADLSGADLRNAYLDYAEMTEAEMTEADLSGADLSDARLEEAKLGSAILVGSYLDNADLSGADLSDARMQDAVLSQADLSPEIPSGSRLPTLERFGSTEPSGADVSAAERGQATCLRVPTDQVMEDFYHQRQTQVPDLPDRTLTQDDLRPTRMRGTNLINARLEETTLCSADLQEADLRGADLRGADLHGAYLRGADLRGADLSDAYLGETDLRGADLRGADLRSADVSGRVDADLSEADLSHADLSSTDVTQEQLDEAESYERATLPNRLAPP